MYCIAVLCARLYVIAQTELRDVLLLLEAEKDRRNRGEITRS